MFFRKIHDILKDRGENRIIIGDFNLTLDIEIDRLNTYNNNTKSLNEVESMMDHFCLIDIWRARHGEKREYSWIKSSRGEETKASRIDLALISGGLDQKVE